jgi:hypothetical protein
VRRRLPLLLTAAFLLGVGTASYLLGLAIGEVRSRGGELEALAEPSTGPSAPGAVGPIDLRAAATVTDFDPPPATGGRTRAPPPTPSTATRPPPGRPSATRPPSWAA